MRWPDWKMLVSNNSFVPSFFFFFFPKGEKWSLTEKSGHKACSPNHSEVTGPGWAVPGNKLSIFFQRKAGRPHLENLEVGWFFFFLFPLVNRNGCKIGWLMLQQLFRAISGLLCKEDELGTSPAGNKHVWTSGTFLKLVNTPNSTVSINKNPWILICLMLFLMNH